MKRYRGFLYFVSALLLIIAMLTLLCVRTVHQEQLNRALIAAIKTNDTTTALAVLNAGADANAKDSGDAPPSVREILKRFIDRLRGSHTNNEPPSSALLTCFHVRLIVRDYLGRLPDTYVSDPDNPLLVKALLEHGADPNVGDENGVTPLMWAISYRWEESISLLLQHHSNVNQNDTEGVTPLHLAARVGNAQTIQCLLDAGADIQASDNAGYTPLREACRFDNPEAIKILLLHCRNINVRAKNGATPLDAVIGENGGWFNDLIKRMRKAGAKTGVELDAASRTNRAKAGGGSEAMGRTQGQETRNP
ncbi:MAG TPA: ankyrin repeat domain-containing protein [Chthonomonadaceae bacterium]|nr:ankyrin repeat domain-containing protein [Chthonomonadaceae bacterium]